MHHTKAFFSISLLFALCQTVGSAVPLINTNERYFADELTKELYSDSSNECTSSWGVSLAFGLVYPSAIGKTADQMRLVLRYPKATAGSQVLKLVWNSTETRMDTKYKGRCMDQGYSSGSDCSVRAPTLRIANKVWIDNSRTLNTSYEKVVGDFASTIDFDATNAGSKINSWVNATTNGLIDSIVSNGPLTDWKLAALNSIYLKASWQNQFAESNTNQDTFYTSASRATATNSNAQFMHIVDYFPYSHTALRGFQILQLPFAGSDLSMLFVLPLDTNSEPAPSASVLKAVSDLVETRVAVALPKFKFESEYEQTLLDALEAIGLPLPFDQQVSGFCMFDSYCTSIDLIVQKTFIDVNERGVEAAAVTMIGVVKSVPSEQPILFQADHPFQFFIYDSKEEVVVFEGQVRNPGIASDATPAQLTAKHSNKDFWTSHFGMQHQPMVVTGGDPTNQNDAGPTLSLVTTLLFVALGTYSLL